MCLSELPTWHSGTSHAGEQAQVHCCWAGSCRTGGFESHACHDVTRPHCPSCPDRRAADTGIQQLAPVWSPCAPRSAAVPIPVQRPPCVAATTRPLTAPWAQPAMHRTPVLGSTLCMQASTGHDLTLLPPGRGRRRGGRPAAAGAVTDGPPARQRAFPSIAIQSPSGVFRVIVTLPAAYLIVVGRLLFAALRPAADLNLKHHGSASDHPSSHLPVYGCTCAGV